jgi:hypothetical protein
MLFEKFLQVSENFKCCDASRQNLFSNFVDLTCLAYLSWLILQPSVASTTISYEFSHDPLALFPEYIYREKIFINSCQEIFNQLPHTFTWLPSPLIIMMETQATSHCCLEPFRWESLWGWDFRPQLVVVSGLFGGNPFVDGILGHNLLLSQAFSVGVPLTMGFRLSRSLFSQ